MNVINTTSGRLLLLRNVYASRWHLGVGPRGKRLCAGVHNTFCVFVYTLVHKCDHAWPMGDHTRVVEYTIAGKFWSFLFTLGLFEGRLLKAAPFLFVFVSGSAIWVSNKRMSGGGLPSWPTAQLFAIRLWHGRSNPHLHLRMKVRLRNQEIHSGCLSKFTYLPCDC